jgi:two-component system response regulator
LKEQLENDRFRVDVREDGASAVRDVLRLRPEVILMDLGLPVIDGWAATKLIRQRARSVPDGYRPYIIVLSGRDDAEARRRAFAAGCDEYVVKTTDVRGALRAYVTRSNTRR